jgi:hypothetical protein
VEYPSDKRESNGFSSQTNEKALDFLPRTAPGKSRRIILALELPFAQALHISPSISASSSFFTTAADAAVEVLNY